MEAITIITLLAHVSSIASGLDTMLNPRNRAAKQELQLAEEYLLMANNEAKDNRNEIIQHAITHMEVATCSLNGERYSEVCIQIVKAYHLINAPYSIVLHWAEKATGNDYPSYELKSLLTEEDYEKLRWNAYIHEDHSDPMDDPTFFYSTHYD